MIITATHARASWFDVQRLGAPSASARRRSVAERVAELGWVPASAGAGAYVALWSREIIERRSDLDDALFGTRELALVPGAKGASWIVPTAEAPVARSFAIADVATREGRVAAVVPIAVGDLERTRSHLREALHRARTPAELLERLPPFAARELGEIGEKNGFPTVAALVLRRMWAQGEVVRLHQDDRIDAPVRAWAIDPMPRVVPPAADAVEAVTSTWLRSRAPLSLRGFSLAFTIAAGRAAAAFEAQHAVRVSIEGHEGLWYAPAGFSPPDPPKRWVNRLLPADDPYVVAGTQAMADAGHDKRLPCRTRFGPALVLVDGTAAGTWSWDSSDRCVRVLALDKSAQADIEHRTESVREELNAFVREQLGDLSHHAAPGARTRRGRRAHPLDVDAPA